MNTEKKGSKNINLDFLLFHVLTSARGGAGKKNQHEQIKYQRIQNKGRRGALYPPWRLYRY